MITRLISHVFDAVKGARMDTPKPRSPVLAELRFAERRRDFAEAGGDYADKSLALWRVTTCRKRR